METALIYKAMDMGFTSVMFDGPAFYHDITCLALEAMKQDIMNALKIFNNI